MKGTTSIETKKQLIRKDLKANLEEIFLRKVLEGPTHGYGVINDIRKGFGILFSPSQIYPFLNSLEEKGYVVSRREYPDGGKPKRVYYPVPSKTAERLKEIVEIKNHNRRTINGTSKGFLSVQLPEHPVIEV